MKGVILLILLYFSGTNAKTDDQYATVTKIVDGDTINVIIDGEKEQKTVRFFCIDTPELHFYGQAQYASGINLGLLAREHLQTMLKVGNSILLLDNNQKTTHGRYVYTIIKGDVNINLKMLEGGFATIDDYYCKTSDLKEYELYKQAYFNAFTEKRGLYSIVDNYTPAKQWRACMQKTKNKKLCNN